MLLDTSSPTYIHNRGVVNGQSGQAAALPKSSDMLTLSQPRGTEYAHPLAAPCLKKIVITPLHNTYGIYE